MGKQPLFKYLALGFLLILFLSNHAHARSEYRSKLGFDLKALKTNRNPELGWVAGLRTNRFLGKSNVYIGLGGYFGSATGGNPTIEQIYYAGIMFGYDCRFSRVILCEVGTLVGYGSGKFTNREPAITESSYFVAEPCFGVGFGLGEGWRIMMSFSYQHLSRGSNFSGVTFGLRIDRRDQTSIKPSDP